MLAATKLSGDSLAVILPKLFEKSNGTKPNDVCLVPSCLASLSTPDIRTHRVGANLENWDLAKFPAFGLKKI